jgi:lipopolysaccharide transport system permease protein
MRFRKSSIGCQSTSIYTPESSLRSGKFSLLGIICNEFLDNRWLMIQIFRRDFIAKYKQSFTGVVWTVIIPVFSISAFVMLHNSGVLRSGSMTVPYPVFAVFGMALWQIFAVGLLSASSSLIDAGAMVVKINFSKKSLVAASFGHALVTFVVYAFVAAAISLYFGFIPSLWLIFLPLLVLPLLLLTMGLGLLFALLNGIARDFGMILSMGLSVMMFITPVFFVNPGTGPISLINRFNPLNYLIVIPREIVLYGASVNWTGYLFSTCFAIAVFFLGVIVFHYSETRIAERI